jgi:hypothetical protein
MITIVGTWKIETNPSKPWGYDAIWKCWREAKHAVSRNEPDLEQEVADFVARQVLERDSVLFDG